MALSRVPRGDGKGGNASLIRALAADLGLAIRPARLRHGRAVDRPAPQGAEGRPAPIHGAATATRSSGWKLLARHLIAGTEARPAMGNDPRGARGNPRASFSPPSRACGPDEGAGLLTALAGQFVAPAPSGAPTRGRLDVLPTGRNFYSVDSRAVPTPTAWALGWKSANLLIEKHLQTHGDWPRTMLLTAWGTANMRTGGDDIAQGLALMGVKPQWDSANRRVTGFEVIPHTVLGRPRVDVTLRVSGFFRDAFPQLIALVDQPPAPSWRWTNPTISTPPPPVRATEDGAQYRVFGSKPGAYGAGLQAMIDERLWADKADLAEAYLEWGSYAYGKDAEGTPGAATRSRPA